MIWKLYSFADFINQYQFSPIVRTNMQPYQYEILKLYKYLMRNPQNFLGGLGGPNNKADYMNKPKRTTWTNQSGWNISIYYSNGRQICSPPVKRSMFHEDIGLNEGGPTKVQPCLRPQEIQAASLFLEITIHKKNSCTQEYKPSLSLLMLVSFPHSTMLSLPRHPQPSD